MRGVSTDTNVSDVEAWLSPDIPVLLDRVDLGESNKRAEELFRNLSADSDVVVYGDYDVDGISSTALALEIVLRKGARVRYFIPHRFNQGYGLHENVAQMIAKRKCDLLIVVDCGTHDAEAIKLVRDSGIPVVVFDHHLVEGQAAECDTLINPQMGGNDLGKKLCATGVLWSWAWRTGQLPEEQLLELLDLVALATIADCVSLGSPLNRAMVQRGLETMRKRPRQGLAILMEKLGITPHLLGTEDLAMKIIPCLNASGRLSYADLAVNILFPGSDLVQQVDKIISLNQKRRALSTRILEQVEANTDDQYRYVLTNDEWAVGVLSSVASRICSKRGKPVALVASVGEIMRGTLRMPNGGDAVGVLKKVSPMLNSWGGHRQAAGFSVKTDNWQPLRDEMEKLLSEVTICDEKEELLHWTPSDLNVKRWSEAEALGPFGMGNPCPILYSPYEGHMEVTPLGKNGKHVKIDLGGSTLLGFGAADLMHHRDALQGWVYKPRIDTWRNMTSLQLILEKMIVV